MQGEVGHMQREVGHMQAPCWARIEAPALEPIPFLHFLKGSLICCCLTFNGKSLGLLRDGSSPGKGECREVSRVHHFGLLLIHLLLIFATTVQARM